MASAKWSDFFLFHNEELSGGRLNKGIIALMDSSIDRMIIYWQLTSFHCDHSFCSCYQRLQDTSAHHDESLFIESCVYSGLCGKKTPPDWNKDVRVNETMSRFPSALCDFISLRLYLSVCPLCSSVSLFVCEKAECVPVTIPSCCDYHANVFH